MYTWMGDWGTQTLISSTQISVAIFPLLVHTDFYACTRAHTPLPGCVHKRATC